MLPQCCRKEPPVQFTEASTSALSRIYGVVTTTSLASRVTAISGRVLTLDGEAAPGRGVVDRRASPV